MDSPDRLSYWESLGYALFGSFLWETGGEKSPPYVKPSINDYVTTTGGGSFVGEAMFRMSSLLLEGTALNLLFGLGASGQIKLRRIDGWRKIAAVLSQHTEVAA